MSPRIVVIGGGTGAPIVIRSLIQAGISNITAISVSMDSGGRTGIIRSDERDRVIAVSDLLRCLLSLITPSQNHLSQVNAFTDLVGFTDGRGRNLGYTVYYALLEKHNNDYLAVQRHFEQLLGIKFSGTAIPVTIEPATICFSTQNGTVYRGEHELDRQSMSTNMVSRFWLEPQVKATIEAMKALTAATHIIYSPGSIYGSILAHFLPIGITASLRRSTAKKILITNLVTTRNQNHNFTPLDYYQLFKKYTRLKKPFDYLIAPDITTDQFKQLHPEIAAHYATEHSFFQGWDKSSFSPLKKLGVQSEQAPIYAITPSLNRLRHDTEKLGQVLSAII